MSFSVIINRLFIGALAFTIFPFYAYAQDDRVEEQARYRIKAWEVGVGGALINWDKVAFSDFRQIGGDYLYRMNIDHLFGGIQLYATRELNPWFYIDLQGALGLARNQIETGGRKYNFMYMVGPELQSRFTPLLKSKCVESYLRINVSYLHHDFHTINAGKFGNDPIGKAEWTSSNLWNKETIGSKQPYFPLSFGARVQAWLSDHQGIGLQEGCIMPVDKNQTRFVQASMRVMFRWDGNTKRPISVVQYIDRPIDRIVGRIVEKRVEVPTVIESHIYDLFDSIHFVLDKGVVTSESGLTLDKIAGLLKSYPDNNFLITRYADTRGGDNYNMGLSRHRVKAVYRALLKRQVPQHMLKWRKVGYHASSVPASGPDRVRTGDRKVPIERVTNLNYWGWLTNEE